MVICIAPLLALMLLLGANSNPIKEVRDLFRDYSGQGKPAFYDQDASNYAKLGTDNKINNFNSTVLHYEQSSGKLFAHSLLAQWAQTVKYDLDTSTMADRACHRLVYRNIVGGEGGQAELISRLKECAKTAADASRKYYIITDGASLPQLKLIFGDRVEYVSSTL
jgi:hypothetical protein